MADTYTKEELMEIYRGLPEEIKDAMFSPATTDIFDAIKEKQALTDEQREIMSVYTGFLMMGVLPPEKYVSTLIEKMGIDREKVASIAQIINRDLFNPIKDILKEVHTPQKNTEETSTSTPTPMAREVIIEPTHTPMSTPAAPTPVTQSTSGASTTPRVTPMMMPEVPKPEALTEQAPITPTPQPTPVDVAPISTPTPKESLPVSGNNPQGAVTQPHIGSIFEQKLGGEFRLKSDAAAYTNQVSGENTGAPSNNPPA
ncbi:MAG: hypothetical protein A2494_03945 [Candidatus Lloydbacteria bacterium RIFOXYC12_FULL_46_25]|uniref:Uncharacterized protein n=1 Tax=Candidatus Lloydbacteria bacterium RIFOXYC12_FULL_46_25 TaxID=1798670 RepID=A0A1G2DSG4_9BACT|nr:MAG: hypothetical protein A2494_03945 [Candidatus Lloydbacteria bacterium RIFOXYC12_FULL_46_25]